MLVGLEKEFFILNPQGEPVLAPSGIPADDCGWLAEARGEPYNNIYEAVYSLKAQSAKIEDQIKGLKQNLVLNDAPVMKIPKALRIKAGRIYVKGLVKYQNLYGYDDHPTKSDESTAGIHISFSSPVSTYTTFTDASGTSHRVPVKYNGNFDWPYIFTCLDHEFRNEIKDSRRRPGFYELKQDGRVEYRSLPANVDLDKVIKIVKELMDDVR